MKRQLNILNRIANDVQLMFRRPAREQYAALCYRLRKKRSVVEILLITSRDTGRWVIPKGWPMPGLTAFAAAEREAWEEAGVKGTTGQTPIGHYTYAKGLPNGLKIDCKVQVYALEVDQIAKNFPEKEERQAEWVDCAEAARRVQEPGLKRLILAFEEAQRADAAAETTKSAGSKRR